MRTQTRCVLAGIELYSRRADTEWLRELRDLRRLKVVTRRRTSGARTKKVKIRTKSEQMKLDLLPPELRRELGL